MDNPSENHRLYCCKICNKNYSSYKSLWNHTKQFHTTNVKNVKQNVKNVKQNVKNVKQDNNKDSQENTKKSLICENCNKIFNTRPAKSIHKKKCMIILNNNDKLSILEEQNNHLQNEINKLKNEFAIVVKEKGKLHHKTLQKFNNKLTNINNGNINSCNTTNNVFVKFGELDYQKIFSPNKIKTILNKKYKALEESVIQTHFNDKNPEYSNIYITNMRDNLAYIFNGKEFIAVNKNETLNSLIDIHSNEINLSLDKYKNQLTKSTINILDSFLNKLNNKSDKFTDHETDTIYSNYRAYKIQAIKLIVYNNSDKNQLKKLKSIELMEKNIDDRNYENIL